MKASENVALRTLGRVEDSYAFPELVVATVGGTPVRLNDLGKRHR